MFSDTVITPLVSFTWSAETQFLSCPTPLCRDFAEAKKLLLIVGAGSQSRTLHFFSGVHGGLWVNLLQMDDPELLLALSNENMWVILFLLALCWTNYSLFFQKNWGMQILFLHHNWNLFPNSGKIRGGEAISVSPCLAVRKGWTRSNQFCLERSLHAWFLVSTCMIFSLSVGNAYLIACSWCHLPPGIN